MTPLDLIDRFAGLNVVILGEAMLDSYLSGHVGRVCREAPVPIVALDERHDAAGGAANAAAAAAGLGAQVRFVSVVGNDEAGKTLVRALEVAGVDTSSVMHVPGRETLVKQRISAHGQLMLRLDRGTEDAIDAVTERRLVEQLTTLWASADAVIISDYGYGIATAAVVSAVSALQRRDPRILVGDAKDLSRWAGVGLTAAKPNYEEALALVSLPPVVGTTARVEQIIEARTSLERETGARIVAVTLDVAGAVVMESAQEPYRTFTQPAADANAAGAGDTFTAALALALAAGAHSAMAADIASAAATACVASAGTTTCTAAMLSDHIEGRRKRADSAATRACIEGWRAASKRIVFTNGCFDILHHGHITYLNRAKALGDVLIVGLNSDASVRALKGPARPINQEDDRAAVLAALSSVDLVVLFDAPTPALLIETIRPDLFVKGGDYTLETLPEAPLVQALGGEVKLLPFLEDRSTSSIIDRIRLAYAPLEAAG